jgi:hypothetical protein
MLRSRLSLTCVICSLPELSAITNSLYTDTDSDAKDDLLEIFSI